MKKIFTLILATLAFAGSAKALDYVPEEGLTFQGLFGMNMSNFNNSRFGTNTKVGFTMGVMAEYMLPKCYGVFANIGANYTLKGAKFQNMVNGKDANIKANAYYIEIPIHVGYRYNLSNQLGLYADFGPYFAFGVNGKNRVNFESDGDVDFRKRFFNNEDETYIGNVQRADFGLGYRIGAEYANQHSLTLSMDWGLTDLYREKYRNTYFLNNGNSLKKLHNYNCSITYGYRF